MMKKDFAKKIITGAVVAMATLSAYAQGYTVIANPGADASRQVRINWHADNVETNTITYTEATDTAWSEAKTLTVNGQLVTAFDSISSKTSGNHNFMEYPHFLRFVVQIDSLEPSTEYVYRIGTSPVTRRFKTGPLPGEEWSAAVISDFHTYPPLNGRLIAAMSMLDTLQRVNNKDFDLLLHVGDVTAWGGSYSFWRQLYEEPWIREHTVAGVIGNHDHMTRRNNKDGRNSNVYFRMTNANPENGYEGERGVCYWFRYGDALFIMLDNEAMRSDEGLEAAQAWVRQVVADNPADQIVVMEHYQWFNGVDGQTSQYSRWHQLFDELGVTLAIGANNHVYARTYPIRGDMPVMTGEGTVYVQTPSSDNERGQEIGEWTYNHDKIASRWSEGGKTVGAMIMRYSQGSLHLALYDRRGQLIDEFVAK